MIHFFIYLPTFNRQALVLKTLQSLSMQTYRHFTVFLLDNASEPPLDIRNLPDDIDLIHMRSEVNRDVDMQNEAVRLMKGTHFTSFADDDVLTPHALEIIARKLNDNSEIESLGVGFSHFDHDTGESISDKRHMNSFTGELFRYDAMRVGIGCCNAWGIGKPGEYKLPRMSHPSATFISRDLIDRTVAKQGELFVRPFGDIGYVGCCFNTKYVHYLDVPLVVLGTTKRRDINSALPNGRMRLLKSVPFLEHTPLRACSFINMSVDGHLKVLYRNGIDKVWDCSLQSAFYLKHLNQIVSDQPWTDITRRDIEEAWSYTVASLMKEYGFSGDEKKRTIEATLDKMIEIWRSEASAKISEEAGLSGSARRDSDGDIRGFTDIVNFAIWQENNFISAILR